MIDPCRTTTPKHETNEFKFGRQTYFGQWAPSQSTMDLWKTTTLHKFHDRLTPSPLLQLYIDYWKTFTSNKLQIYSRMHIVFIFSRWTLPPPIKHRSLENHYTTQVSYIAECTLCSYLEDGPLLLQSSIDLWKTTTHPLLQSSICLCNTITPQKFHIEQDAHKPIAD